MLEGSVCRLRPTVDGDAATFLTWRADAELRDGALGHPFPSHLEAEAAWLRAFNIGPSPQAVLFAIEACESGRLAGYVTLRGIDWIARAAEIGIVVGEPTLRRRGIGREATALLLRYAVEVVNLRRLWLRVRADNAPALRIYQGLGFAVEGCLREHVWRDGAYRDLLIMGLLARPPGQDRVAEA